MKPKRFIVKRLMALYKSIPGISLVYVYEQSIAYHTIIVSPSNVFIYDSKYNEIEDKIMKEFYRRYDGEDILFTDSVDTIDLSDVILRLDFEK